MSSPPLPDERPIRFAYTDEQHELQLAVRRFLQEKSAETAVRQLMQSPRGYDPAVWTQMAEQLGLQSVAIPEAYGGAGLGAIELSMILEEMGAVLLCAPYFSTVVLAANTLLTAGDAAAQREYLPPIAAGQRIGTLAIAEDDGSWDLERIALEARSTSRGWQLTGRKLFVTDGVQADLLLVVGRTPDGLGVFVVAPDASGLQRSALETIDQTRKQARLEFAETPARLIGTPGAETQAGLRRTLDLAAVGLAAEQVGGAQRCLDMAVAYARTRLQFGRPIGSFQAIKHLCADLLVAVESARSAAAYAAWAADQRPDELPAVASLAKSVCSEAFSLAAAENIQIHGGMGFTWEHPAHLYYRRARSTEYLLGDPASHRERFLQRLGL